MSNKNSILMISLILLMSITYTYGQNQTTIGIGSGISKAVGEGSESWNIGYCVSLESFKQVSENLFVGGRFAYNRLSPNKDEVKKNIPFPDTFGDISSGISADVTGSTSIIELLPSIRIASFKNQDQQIQFFGQVGAGCHIFKMYAKTFISDSFFEGTATVENFEIEFGINFGAGIIFCIAGNTKLSIYPMYNIIFTEEESTKYVTVNFGVLF